MRFAVLVLCLSMLACDDEEVTSPTPAPTETPEQTPEPTEPTAQNAPSGPMNEAAARALLDAWLAAQNEGDLEAYSVLFASRFEGVKRAEERVYRFTREGWLENRARMFQRPMNVTLSDVTADVTSTTAVLRFTQRWSSATFQDVGPKEIIVVVEDGELRIAREVMLASESNSVSFAGEVFMLAFQHSGLYVVLDAQSDEEATGSPMLVPRVDGPFAADMASQDSGEEGRLVRVFAADGTHCDGTLGSPRLMRRVIPHFSAVQVWNDEEGRVYSDEDIASDVWTMGAERTLRVAKVEGCTEGLWVAARSAEPVIYAQTQTPDEASERAFRGLDAWSDLQTVWTDEFGEAGPWDAPEPTTEFQTWTHGEQSVVTVKGRGGFGCGRFYGRLSGIFEVSGARRVPRAGTTAPLELDFRAVVDIDGDGTPEIVVEDGLLRRSGDHYERALDITPPFLDCGC